jgi:hypothetical protein
MDPAYKRPESELTRARSATFWKVIVSASAAAAVSIASVTWLRDRSDAREEAQHTQREPAAAVAARQLPRVPVRTATELVVPSSDTAFGASTTVTTITTSARPDAVDVAARSSDLAAPTIALTAAPATRVATAGRAGSTDAGPTSHAPELTTAEASPPHDEGEARDASASTPSPPPRKAAPNPWAPPRMSAGAGPFLTEAPYWAASAFVSNPEAGAGRFITDAPPWAASAFTSNPNAGAGPFTTERNIPAYGVLPYYLTVPWGVPPPP